MNKKVYITDASRTAVASLGKTLKEISAVDLGACVISNTIKRSKEDEVDIGSSLNLLNLSDFLVIKNWLNYAKILGDTSYKQVFTNYIEDNFLNKILEKQYDFRKKEF